MFSGNISNAERSKFTESCIGASANIRDDLPSPMGVAARYVRLMRSADAALNIHIQISKLEVIDRSGQDVALNKTSSAKSQWPGLTKDKPVNGKEWFYWNMYHDDNRSHGSPGAAQEYWMVDLGEMKDVCLINYYNRVDCCQERSKGIRLQLLDANKNVIAEKILGLGFIQSFSFMNASNNNPENVKKLLLSYDNAVSLVQYDRVRGKKLFLSYMQQYTGGSPNENDQNYNNIRDIGLSLVPASFRLRFAEKGRANEKVTLTPVGKPNAAVRHQGFKLYADVPQAIELFRNDSTFMVVAGSTPGHIRLQSANFPDRFIGTRNDSNGKLKQDGVFIIKPDEGNIEWGVELPFQTSTAGPEVFLSAYRRYDFDYNTAQQRCSSQGARLATRGELEEAQRKGAQWCNYGHVAGGGMHAFPMQVASPSCGNRVGVFQAGRPNNARADVNCYGVKPSPDFVGTAPFALNTTGPQIRQTWSQHDV
jgi:hypothetical protein